MEAMSKKPPMPEPSAKVFYMLGCLECGDPDRVLLMSFASPAERGHWGSEHIKATGHDRWIVIDQPDGILDSLREWRSRARAAG